MKELVIFGKPQYTGRQQNVDIPKPGPKEVLIKVVVAGLNPKDWKFTKSRDESAAINAGDDVAGIVHSVGEGVFEYRTGDRVAAFHRMGEPGGCYAEYTVCPVSTTFLLPPNVSFEEGATLPLAAMTAALALYQALQLPLPTVAGPKDIPVLIYGGASTVGAYALKFAKLSKLNPIITIVGKGIDFVKSLDAATHIVDYRQGNVADEVLKILDGKKLGHVFDAISGNGTHEVVADILVRSGGGKVDMVDPVTDESWKWPESVEASRTLVASAYFSKHPWISEERAVADGEFAYFFYRYMTYLLAEGKLKPHPFEVVPNGLDGIIGGVQALYERKVSAKKLVARIADTPGLS